MKITFGNALDGPAYPVPNSTRDNHLYVGPAALRHLLERILGLGGHEENNDYLRIEHYRQALTEHLTQHPDAFYRDSFEADPFGTATDLLDRRDELKMGGWDFQPTDDLPDRLRTLARLENYLCAPDCPQPLSSGVADRLDAILRRLPDSRHGITEVRVIEPLALLPAPWTRIFDALGVPVRTIDAEVSDAAATDLDHWRAVLRSGKKPTKIAPRGDGSLLLLRAPRSVDAAAYLARLLRENPDFRPLCLLPERERTLDEALIQQGLPALGIESPSLARPSLQILKLVTAFLWEPIDPFKILEFLSLHLKPLDDGIARIVAKRMSESPGMALTSWIAEINDYLESDRRPADVNPVTARRQFNFWFDRERYDIHATVPKSEAIRVFDYLYDWAVRDDKSRKSLGTLAGQTRRIRDLLYDMPENELTALQMERVVRTIYEPAPIEVVPGQVGHLEYVYQNAGILEPVDALLWLNFGQHEPAHFFSRWYRDERTWLEAHGVQADGPARQNALLLWSRVQPVLRCRKQLMLVVPESVNGTHLEAHPLYADLEATFTTLQPLTYDLATPAGQLAFEAHFHLPTFTKLEAKQHRAPGCLLQHPRLGKLPAREAESFSSLQTLFYYPHQWVFQYLLKIRGSDILAVADENRMKGNMAHRIFEALFNEDWEAMDDTAIRSFVRAETTRRLRREGAVLLMYGREPERVNFEITLQNSALTLCNALRRNGWSVHQTEHRTEAPLFDTQVRGVIDLILKRGEQEYAILDLKWSGYGYRRDQLTNRQDLQLVLYSKLFGEPSEWAHTAFYVISRGQLLARNTEAFREAETVETPEDFRAINQGIFEQMRATLDWRRAQIARGELEIRTTDTYPLLEELYAEQDPDLLLSLLEMKSESDRFDAYGLLVG